jgi:MFS transporter, DHA1 family, purine ribonucleoside efflux pump
MNDLSQDAPPDHAWSPGTWFAMLSLTLGSFALAGSELLPMGLLTPMARDIGVSEGAAGQTVTLTALLAGIAAPTVALVIRQIDRKPVVLLLTALVVLSNLLVAIASDYVFLLLARTLLGIAVGGFFALIGATIVRLVSLQGMGKGMAVVFFGLAAATTVAPPIGALIGEALGWRSVFFMAAGLGLLALLAQAISLPSVPAGGGASLAALLRLAALGKVRVGLLAIVLVFGGNVAGSTFIRPYLETGAGLDAGAVAAVLLAYGVATLIGNGIGGVAADRALRLGFTLTCLVIGAATLALANFGADFTPALTLAFLWGLGSARFRS